MSKRLILAAVAAMSSFAACSSGGGNVTGNNSLNPTAAPSGGATASPTASGATPTATATATSTSVAMASPTATATATSTSVATATPTATATATATSTAVATSCTTSTAGPSTMTYTLNGSAVTIQLPTYNVFSGSSNVPTNSPAGTVLTIKLSQNNFDNVAASVYGSRTPDLFTSLSVSQSTQFGGSNNNQLLIPVTINSPCVVSGRTYTVNEYDSTLGVALYSETDTPTMAGSVTGHIQVSVNPFPSGQTVDIVVSH